jgi:hypothetical protein
MPTIQATGQPWEVTQQTSVPHGITTAAVQQLTEGKNSIGIKLGELTSNSQETMPTQQASPIVGVPKTRKYSVTAQSVSSNRTIGS